MTTDINALDNAVWRHRRSTGNAAFPVGAKVRWVSPLEECHIGAKKGVAPVCSAVRMMVERREGASRLAYPENSNDTQVQTMGLVGLLTKFLPGVFQNWNICLTNYSLQRGTGGLVHMGNESPKGLSRRARVRCEVRSYTRLNSIQVSKDVGKYTTPVFAGSLTVGSLSVLVIPDSYINQQQRNPGRLSPCSIHSGVGDIIGRCEMCILLTPGLSSAEKEYERSYGTNSYSIENQCSMHILWRACCLGRS